MATRTVFNLSLKSSERNMTVSAPADIIVPKPPRKKPLKLVYPAPPRPRAQHEATSRLPYSTEHYKTGDGDILQPRRAGSDHSRFKSFGTLC